MFHRHRPTTTTTRTTKPTFMTRLKGRNARTQTVKTKTTTTRHEGRPSKGRKWGRPTTQQRRRRVTFGDKVSGAMLKLKGSLTNRPAVKVNLSLEETQSGNFD
ncbi:hypothetical protein N7474_002259 [Penicillium riverlandense]|uniref:uncharacterized protein n=1 Tax=Penicillium riverlandense TaxID=1903569 RepID=UPI00254775E8|nr:uncharacterized protein N7474_002259 [Penicillium riverlandense]KAJ5833948.1 hypothetical protein N7474_002259 [Penicillium riverlandense]